MPEAQAPTIGRRVYFWPTNTGLTSLFNIIDETQPLDAGVVFVHPNGTVNLVVSDHLGRTQGVQDVPFGDTFRAEDEAVQDAGGRADWMPYQKGASHTAAPAGDPPGTSLLGANVHGIGPDVGGGANPHYKGG